MPDTRTNAPLCLRAMGSFHVSGRRVLLEGRPPYVRTMSEGGEPVSINPNGSYLIEQMYVQYFLPQHSNGKGPLVFWHGGGMTGATWETTPDGREGWANYFVRQGWDVYVCDAVERGRSGFAPHPDIWPEGPVVQTVDDIHTRFRIGDRPGSYHTDPARRSAYPDTRFPLESFDTFCLQMVPRWTHTNTAMIEAFHILLKRIGRSTIICHSQAGPLAMMLAAQAGDLIRALVAIEPAGIASLAPDAYNTPTLVVMGGNMADDKRWQRLSQKISSFAQQHPSVQILHLEELGIHGNSHVLMMDTNSDDIACRVNDWLSHASGV
ncbi:hypothetical protein H0A62_05800 [Pusillimonas harenae]|uniref:AB hydrolase-1 domain-containing protein n=2 Tax=Pollutimonas harenae TaxID=657015 RepID=A0A853GSF0_9BURK|nr:alpha/beta fold hydrolase [Pollutimonas harenae]NYT85111.1 hypothetical protein [Pollutimonas harenae]TEA72508.1 hypothetical protein ERD84_00925 [Pollutimonas harenae]